LALGCGRDEEIEPTASEPIASIQVQSAGFSKGAEIPTVYTCEGKDVSPPLSWTEIPETAKSLALIVDDPDAPDPAAPKRTWVHWVLYNVPPTTKALGQAASKPAGAADGHNDWGASGYRGPCPPIGRHRYFFKLFAVDTKLSLDHPTSAQLQQAMAGHIVAQGTLMGTYAKSE
jgi:Raf kinase inhibitor-like YbhB/YbcL family protein